MTHQILSRFLMAANVKNTQYVSMPLNARILGVDKVAIDNQIVIYAIVSTDQPCRERIFEVLGLDDIADAVEDMTYVGHARIIGSNRTYHVFTGGYL